MHSSVGVQASPAVQQLDRGRGQQPRRQHADILHDVGQTHRELLPQEHERRALTGVGGTWRSEQKGSLNSHVLGGRMSELSELRWLR